MDLIGLRDRIRSKAISSGLTYTEIETLFDVNELLNQTLPCLMWQYAGETNDFSESTTEMTLNVYLLANYHDSLKTESAAYQRDYIVTQYNALREYFITWVKALPFEGDDYLEVLTTEEIPIAERLSIEGFLTMEFRVNINLKRNFCIDPEEITPTADEVKVYFNSLLKYTQAANVDLQLTLKNQNGEDIAATFTGYDIVVTQPVVSDARVSNSDDTYDVSVASGGDLELPDITVMNTDSSFSITSPSVKDVRTPDVTISNSDNSYSVTSPSMLDVDIPDESITVNGAAFITKPSKKDEDILLRDVSGNTITPESLTGRTITILDASSPKGLMPLQTGAVTSYATNDDGDLQRGRLTDFDTIPYDNPFGGTDRFTDSVGTQSYADGIIIDWSTWDGGSAVLGYSTSNNSSTSGKQIWSDWMTNSPYSVGTFSNWYVANSNEMFRVMESGTTFLNYSPFSSLNPAGFWVAFSSTTTEVSSNVRAKTGQSNIDYMQRTLKSASNYALLVRDFTITGTTLS